MEGLKKRVAGGDSRVRRVSHSSSLSSPAASVSAQNMNRIRRRQSRPSSQLSRSSGSGEALSSGGFENISQQPDPPSTTSARLSHMAQTAGFLYTDNFTHWESTIMVWLRQDFDPMAILTRKYHKVSLPYAMQDKWNTCVRAFLLLQDQLTSLNDPILSSKCHFFFKSFRSLLLHGPSHLAEGRLRSLVQQRFQHFLAGNWKLLYADATRQAPVFEIRLPQPPDQRADQSGKLRAVTEKARKGQLSSAMRILRSAGLASGTDDEIQAHLDKLFPPQLDNHGDWDSIHNLSHEYWQSQDMASFNGDWVKNLLIHGRRGKAEDQWGWDARESWISFTRDPTILDLLAKMYFVPILKGDLPHSHQHLTLGGKLVLIQKPGKVGFRPIVIGDADRRFVAKYCVHKLKNTFQIFFQEHHPAVKQFCAATPSGQHNMIFMMRALEQEFAKDNLSDDPRVFVIIDIVNAFNSLSREALIQLFTDPQLASTLPELKLIAAYFKAFYSAAGEVGTFINGKRMAHLCREGLLQGDPLSLPLFALGFHLLLEEVVLQCPGVAVSAFADNAAIQCRLSQVPQVHNAFIQAAAKRGLKLNLAESSIYIPAALANLEVCNLAHTCPPMVQSLNNKFVVPVGEGISLPVTDDGFCLLGAPFGLSEYHHRTFRKIIDKVQKDLHLLAQVPHLHLRAKLLTYCTNTRFDYFMGTDKLAVVMQYATMVDHLIHDATCDLLGWPRGDDSHNAVVQLRLPIAQGGWGLHCKCVQAPAANLGPFLCFTKWLSGRTDLQELALYGTALSHSGFLSVNYQDILTIIQANNSFPVLERIPQEPGFAGIPSATTFTRWPSDALPSQKQLFGHCIATFKSQLRNRLGSVNRDFVTRLDALKKEEFPAMDPASAFMPPLSDLSEEPSSLYHSPLSFMSLRNNLEFLELQDVTFVIITSLQCGMPIPIAIREHCNWDSSFDEFGHQALNSKINNLRIPTHDVVAEVMKKEFHSLGIQATCKAREIPRTGPDSNVHGDIYIRTKDICPRSRAFNADSVIVLDNSLVHSGNVDAFGFHFIKDKVRSSENGKFNTYKDYRSRNVAFAPLVADSYGRIGAHALRVFMRLALHISGFSVSGSDASFSYGIALYHRLRLTFLRANLEACAERLLRALPSSVVLPLGAPVAVISYPFPLLVPTPSTSQVSLSSSGDVGSAAVLPEAPPSSPPVVVPLRRAGSPASGLASNTASPSWADVLRGPQASAIAGLSRRPSASSTPSSSAVSGD